MFAVTTDSGISDILKDLCLKVGLVVSVFLQVGSEIEGYRLCMNGTKM